MITEPTLFLGTSCVAYGDAGGVGASGERVNVRNIIMQITRVNGYVCDRQQYRNGLVATMRTEK